MSSAGSQERALGWRRDVREVRVVNWPLRRSGIGPWLLLAGCIGISTAVGVLSANWYAGVASIVALLISLWRLWVPVTFELGPRGIVQTVWGRSYRISWREFARFQVLRSGVLLLVDPRPSPLDAFRGLFVRFDGQKDDVLAVVNYFMAPDRSRDSSVSRRGRAV